MQQNMVVKFAVIFSIILGIATCFVWSWPSREESLFAGCWKFFQALFYGHSKVVGGVYVTVTVVHMIVLGTLGLCASTLAILDGVKPVAILSTIVAVGVAATSMNVLVSILDSDEESTEDEQSEEKFEKFLVAAALETSSIFTAVMGIFQGIIAASLLMAGNAEIIPMSKLWISVQLGFTGFYSLVLIVLTTSMGHLKCKPADAMDSELLYIKALLFNIVFHQFVIPPLYAMLALSKPCGIRNKPTLPPSSSPLPKGKLPKPIPNSIKV